MVYIIHYKVTGHSKINFFLGFPPSVEDFFVIKHVHLNARVSGYLDLKSCTDGGNPTKKLFF